MFFLRLKKTCLRKTANILTQIYIKSASYGISYTRVIRSPLRRISPVKRAKTVFFFFLLQHRFRHLRVITRKCGHIRRIFKTKDRQQFNNKSLDETYDAFADEIFEFLDLFS